ncbi:MAG: hypothetical protein DRH12_14780 [Deltaproteobacteria bacterium]|nr:MAG: hypothetical protein DRH12_14780 [Deltaproteobacteria bacterium]
MQSEKTRFRLIAFVLLPLLIIIGYILSLIVMDFIHLQIDFRGKVIMAMSSVPLYIFCILSLKRKLEKHRCNDE